MSAVTAKSVPQQEIQRAEFLAWATGLGAITPEALAERHDLSTAVAQERLDEAVGLRLMEKHSLLVGYSELYTVTVTGRNLARRHAGAGKYSYAKGLAVSRIGIQNARHMIACAGVAAALERRYPGHRVIGERELHNDERKQGRRVASVEIPLARDDRRSHFPDIVVWPPGTLDDPDTPAPSGAASAPPALPVAVEVELTWKPVEVLMETCRAWASCRYVEATLYFAENTKVEERLLDVIEELKAEEMIVVNPLGAIIKPLPGFEFLPWSADD